jgi:glycerol kinase
MQKKKTIKETKVLMNVALPGFFSWQITVEITDYSEVRSMLMILNSSPWLSKLFKKLPVASDHLASLMPAAENWGFARLTCYFFFAPLTAASSW